jgi:predicted nucleotidyltransferase
MSAFLDTLAVLCRTFESAGLRWYLFGAQAVAVRGTPRATQDIDVTVDIDADDIEELLATLAAKGMTHRYPDQADELLRRGAVAPLVSHDGMEVDLVLARSGLESLALSRATVVPIGDLLVPVAHATDLLLMKVIAGRGKDLDDARSLLAAGEVDVVEVRSLLEQLEEALGSDHLIPSFEALLRSR